MVCVDVVHWTTITIVGESWSRSHSQWTVLKSGGLSFVQVGNCQIGTELQYLRQTNNPNISHDATEAMILRWDSAGEP
jgi:hypothetical protein